MWNGQHPSDEFMAKQDAQMGLESCMLHLYRTFRELLPLQTRMYLLSDEEHYFTKVETLKCGCVGEVLVVWSTHLGQNGKKKVKVLLCHDVHGRE